MGDVKQEEKLQFTLPIHMLRHGTFASYESTLPPLVTSHEHLLANLNITNMGLTMCRPNASLFSIPAGAPYSTFKCPKTWESILMTEEAIAERNRVFDKLRQKVYQGETIFPKEECIHRAFEECPLNKIKVVLIAQDPYHKIDNILGREIASGLAFSGLYGGEKPNSMNKIFTELRRTFPGIELEHWDLVSWARQGVLLLNTALTVRMGEANSHGKEKLWKYYVEYIIRQISEKYPNVFFVLWGAHAKELAERSSDPPIGNKSKVLKCGHPSGLNTSKSKESGFDENGHFSAIYYEIYRQNVEIERANQNLQKQGKPLLPYVEQIDCSLRKADYERMLVEDKWRAEEESILLAKKVEEEKFELECDENNEDHTVQVTTQQSNIPVQGQNITISTPMLEYTPEQIQQLLSQGYSIEQIQAYQQQYIHQYYQKLYEEEYRRKQDEYQLNESMKMQNPDITKGYTNGNNQSSVI